MYLLSLYQLPIPLSLFLSLRVQLLSIYECYSELSTSAILLSLRVISHSLYECYSDLSTNTTLLSLLEFVLRSLYECHLALSSSATQPSLRVILVPYNSIISATWSGCRWLKGFATKFSCWGRWLDTPNPNPGTTHFCFRNPSLIDHIFRVG